jgi:hypothetical protein
MNLQRVVADQVLPGDVMWAGTDFGWCTVRSVHQHSGDTTTIRVRAPRRVALSIVRLNENIVEIQPRAAHSRH